MSVEQSAAEPGATVTPRPSEPDSVAATVLRGPPATLLILTFATAIFLNAALLFSVQPMFTKMVLPLLGGTPAVWNTCLLFFQTALLGGYLYAHLTSRYLSLKVQAAAHVALLMVSFTVLPLQIPAAWARPPGTSLPIGWLLGLLTVSLGLPFVLLSAGAPMLQRWFAGTRHRSAHNPYFLYAASNLGSFAALLAYPFLIEPRLRVSEQTVAWLAVYCALLALIAFSAALAYRVRRRQGVVMASPLTASPLTASPVPAGDTEAMASAGATDDTAAAPPGGGITEMPGALVVEMVEGEAHVRRPGALRGSVRRLIEEHPEVVDALLAPAERGIADPTIVPDRHWRLRWVLLSFAPASLLIGVTTYLSTDIASAPFLWVIPLALYLLTFVLVFAQRPLLPRTWVLRAQLVLALTLMVLLAVGPRGSIANQASWHLVAFFLTAMVCHRELADSRPKAAHLTEFYLWMSFGGVLGGVFNVIVAPLLYQSLIEYPFALVVALGLRPSAGRTSRARGALVLDVALPALLMAVIWFLYRLPSPPGEWFANGSLWFLGATAGVVTLFQRRPLRLALGAGAMLAGVRLADVGNEDILLQRRSFFGVYRVRRMSEYHVLQHGTTTHGGQSRDPDRRLEPLTYYHREGPMGHIFASVVADRGLRRVAVVGLGTGTTACYGRPGERWTFFEIDPLVVQIASTRRLFTYLNDCPPEVEMALGDARLSLAREPDGEYDLIILDAFSSDAIPVHLLTREALDVYLRKLRPGGAVAYHISNRYLDLRPVLIALANDARLPGAMGDFTARTADRTRLHYGSRWIVLAEKPSALGALIREEGWMPLPPGPTTRVWTDDFSDILGVMKW